MPIFAESQYQFYILPKINSYCFHYKDARKIKKFTNKESVGTKKITVLFNFGKQKCFY